MQKIAKPTTFSWPHVLHAKSPLVELLVSGIKEAYWAENHLVRALLKLTNAATSGEVKNILDHHIQQTKIHATKLEHVFELMDETIDARKSDSMAGIVADANEAIEYTDEGTATRDTAITLACQKIEQYEIVNYSGLIKLATTISHNDVADLLFEILSDEIECNELLLNQTEIVTLRAVEEI